MKIATIILTVILLTVAQICEAFALSKLWLWFIVSTFHVIPLGVAQALGIATTIRFLTYQWDARRNSTGAELEKLMEAGLYGIFASGIVLLFGWTLKAFL